MYICLCTINFFIIFSAFGAALQGALFGMAGMFPSRYIQAVMAGQVKNIHSCNQIQTISRNKNYNFKQHRQIETISTFLLWPKFTLCGILIYLIATEDYLFLSLTTFRVVRITCNITKIL